MTKVLHLPLAPASVSQRTHDDMIPGTMSIYVEPREPSKNNKARTLPSSFANGCRREGVGRCGGEALTQGDVSCSAGSQRASRAALSH